MKIGAQSVEQVRIYNSVDLNDLSLAQRGRNLNCTIVSEILSTSCEQTNGGWFDPCTRGQRTLRDDRFRRYRISDDFKFYL